MIRRPVVIGSAMLLSAAAWSVGPWRMMRILKNRVVSKELQQAIDSVSGALNVLEQKMHPNGSQYPALVNLLILSTLHQRKLVAHRQRKAENPAWKESQTATKESTKVLNEAARYMRFAACAYGFVVVKGFQILDKDAGWPSFSELTSDQADKWCILQHTGINETDLLHINLTDSKRSSIHLPCHFLAIDHATKSIVLAIRGTRSLKDTAVNLMCDNIPFCGGQVHRGIAESTMCLLSHMQEDINDAIDQNPGYRLVFTGHSLGGAAALLLAFMVKEAKPQFNVEAFAFGPPPSFAPLSNIPSSISECMHSFIYGEDIVPRLSLASCTQLMEAVVEVDLLDATLRERLGYLFEEMYPTLSLQQGEAAGLPLGLRWKFSYNKKISQNGGGFPGDPSSIIRSYISEKLLREEELPGDGVCVEDGSQLHSHSPIYIPGNIFMLSSKDSEEGEEEGEGTRKPLVTYRNGSPYELSELLLTESAIKHHVVNTYVGWFSDWDDREWT